MPSYRETICVAEINMANALRLDRFALSMENLIMTTIEAIVVDPDTEALIESLSTGKPLAPEIRDRMRAEARRLTEELRKTHGVQEISAQLIRESRDEA
jgi:hypothetical protein